MGLVSFLKDAGEKLFGGKRALLQAFQVLDDADLVGSYRRKMASLLF